MDVALATPSAIVFAVDDAIFFGANGDARNAVLLFCLFSGCPNEKSD